MTKINNKFRVLDGCGDFSTCDHERFGGKTGTCTEEITQGFCEGCVVLRFEDGSTDMFDLDDLEELPE